MATKKLSFGAVGGGLLSAMLVTVLKGVFDPPPSVAAVPWSYLALIAALTVAALAAAAAGAARLARRPALEVVRRL